MRHIHYISVMAAASAVFIFQACGGKSIARATKTADDFVTSVFSAEYDHAAELCCDSLKNKVLNLKKLSESSDEGILSRVIEHGKSLEWKSEKVETSDKHDVCLKYSTLFQSTPYELTLTLSRVGNDTLWAVTGIR